MRFEFAFEYSTRTVAISGTASVVGDYDGPSKPEAMIRYAMARTGNLKMVWMNEPVNEDACFDDECDDHEES